jgi:hypothetical protein
VALLTSAVGIALGFVFSLVEFFFWQLFHTSCDPGSLNNCVSPDFAAYFVSSDGRRSLSHGIMNFSGWAGLVFSVGVIVLSITLKSSARVSAGAELAKPFLVVGILGFIFMAFDVLTLRG